MGKIKGETGGDVQGRASKGNVPRQKLLLHTLLYSVLNEIVEKHLVGCKFHQK